MIELVELNPKTQYGINGTFRFLMSHNQASATMQTKEGALYRVVSKHGIIRLLERY